MTPTLLREHRGQQPEASTSSNLENPFQERGDALDMTEFDELMAKDKLFQSIIHQNSRKLRRRERQGRWRQEMSFPETQVPRVVPYDFGVHYRIYFMSWRHAFAKSDTAVRLADVLPVGLLDRQGHRHHR